MKDPEWKKERQTLKEDANEEVRQVFGHSGSTNVADRSHIRVPHPLKLIKNAYNPFFDKKGTKNVILGPKKPNDNINME